MDAKIPSPITENELHALLDGQLSLAEQAALHVRLAQDPAAGATLAAWRAQREALHGMHLSLLDEPVSPALLAAAQRTAGAARQQLDRWRRWGGMAAGVLLAFGVGWLSHGQWQALHPATTQTLARVRAGQEFAREAAVAYAVYAPELRHPVEVTAAQQDHLVQWLSKRLGRPLKIPDLSGQGYELVGGRLLPGIDGARAQFMYQDAAGERVTLYLGAIDGKTTDTPRRETAFQFSTEGPVPGFYWVDQGFGYALAGKLSRDDLMKLAQAVYPQL